MNDTPVGKAIARARQRKRWTQAELANRLGVSANSVCAWENGKSYPRRNAGAVEELLQIDLSACEPEPVQ